MALKRRALIFGGGALALAALTALNIGGADVSLHVAMALLVAGVIGVGAGLAGRGLMGPRAPRDLAALTAILLLAAAVRLWDLGVAVHFFVDEENFLRAVLRLRDGQESIQILRPFSAITAFTWAHPYLQWLGIAARGPDLAGLRLPSAFFGVLTVAAIYQLGRALFDRRVGLLAALLLAGFPAHIHFSRLGLNNIVDPLFGVLALALLARGLRRGGRADYALGGVALGLTQYFYEGGRLLYPALIGLWLPVALIGWRVRTRRLLWFIAPALMVAAPVYLMLATLGDPAAYRLSEGRIDGAYLAALLLANPADPVVAAFIETQLLPPLLHYVHLPEQGTYYGGDWGLLLPPLLPFALIGLAALIRRPVIGALVIAWPLLTAVGSSLLVEQVWTARFVVAFPALALLVALGVRQAARRRPMLAAGIALALAVGQIGYYFGPHLTRYNQQLRGDSVDLQDALWRVRDLPRFARVYLITRAPEAASPPPLVEYMARLWGIDLQMSAHTPEAFAAEVDLDHLAWQVDRAFFVEPGDTITQALLRDRLGPVEPMASPYPVPAGNQLWLFYYPWEGRAGSP